MPGKKAKAHYLSRRYNCAQSVVAALQEHFGLDAKEIDRYLGHGGGNAPGGLCGALSAARDLLTKHHPNKVAEFDRYFTEQAGSLKCQEIRKLRKLSCLGCIEKAANWVAKPGP